MALHADNERKKKGLKLRSTDGLILAGVYRNWGFVDQAEIQKLIREQRKELGVESNPKKKAPASANAGDWDRAFLCRRRSRS